jgi:hypothetical protein
MKRSVGPLFAVIVILVALVLGALWFVVRYRTHEAREGELVRVRQQQADQAVRLRRSRGGGQGRAAGRTRGPAAGAQTPAGEEAAAGREGSAGE